MNMERALNVWIKPQATDSAFKAGNLWIKVANEHKAPPDDVYLSVDIRAERDRFQEECAEVVSLLSQVRSTEEGVQELEEKLAHLGPISGRSWRLSLKPSGVAGHYLRRSLLLEREEVLLKRLEELIQALRVCGHPLIGGSALEEWSKIRARVTAISSDRVLANDQYSRVVRIARNVEWVVAVGLAVAGFILGLLYGR